MSDQDISQPGQVDMPIWQRLLTPQEIQKATGWINERAARANDPCQICDSPNSMVQPGVVPMNGGMSPYGDGAQWIHPCVVVICQNCGYMRYFNAVIMGLAAGYKPTTGDGNGSAD